MAANFMAKFGYMRSFRSSVLKRLAISPFRFKNIQWQYISYILCKIDDRSSNARDYEGNNCTFLDETAKNGISHQISQQLYKTDLHQLFSISRHMYGDYKADISFAEAQGTWLMVTN